MVEANIIHIPDRETAVSAAANFSLGSCGNGGIKNGLVLSSCCITYRLVRGVRPVGDPHQRDQLFAGNENQVRETLRLVEEVTYDLTSQSVPRPDPVRSIPNQILGHMKVI